MKFLHFFGHYPAWLVVHTWAYNYFGGTSSLDFWLISLGAYIVFNVAKDITLEKVGSW